MFGPVPPAEDPPKTLAPELPDPRLDENEKVFLHRQDALLRAGYPPRTARKIADDRDIDLHRACELGKNAGPELAAEILL